MPRKLKCECGECKVCKHRAEMRDLRSNKLPKWTRDDRSVAFTGKWPKVRLELGPLDVLASRVEGFGWRV